MRTRILQYNRLRKLESRALFRRVLPSVVPRMGLIAASLGLCTSGSRAQTPVTPQTKPPTQTAKPAPPNKGQGGGSGIDAVGGGAAGGLLGLPAATAKGPLLPAPLPKQTPEEWARKGRAAMSSGKVDDAIIAFRQLVMLRPLGAEGWFDLGAALSAARRYSEAAQAFQTLSRITPANAQSYAMLANALAQSNQTDAALSALNRAIELSPATTQYQLVRGELLMGQKAYKQAQSAYLQALGTAPDDPRVHIGLGDADEQDGQHLAALGEYEAALLVDPSNLGARIGRAASLASLKRMTEAELVITRTRQALDASDTALQARLASVGGDAQAQAQMRAQMAVLASQKAILHSAYAQILDGAQRREDAIREYQAALEIAADSATTWGNLGWTQYEAGQYEAAIQSSHKALALDGGLAYVRLNLGLTYATQDKWLLAEQEYRAALGVAARADIEAGISDVRAAISRQPQTRALQRALVYLTFAANKPAR